MRAAPGTQIVLFDGSGAEFPAIVQRVGRNEVELSVTSRAEISRELPVARDARRRPAEGRATKMAGREGRRSGRGADCPSADPAGGGSTGRAGPVAAAAGRDRGLETVRPQSPVADRRAARLARLLGKCGRPAVPALGPAARLSPRAHICPFRRNWPTPSSWPWDRRAGSPARRRLWRFWPVGTPSTLGRARCRVETAALDVDGDGRPAHGILKRIHVPLCQPANVFQEPFIGAAQDRRQPDGKRRCAAPLRRSSAR